MEPSKMITH
jgi:hypothetical protein